MRQFQCISVAFLSFVLLSCSGYIRKDPNLDLGQNWGVDDQQAFYQTSQGSQLIQYTWFLALEQPGNDKLFLENDLQRFGYLPDIIPSSEDYNPDHLPVGFVRDDDEQGAWIGMTCAACHTSELIINGQAHRIDGSPTDADFIAFIGELDRALSETTKDPEKFKRFAQRVKAESKRLGLPVPDNDDLRGGLFNKSKDFAGFFGRSRPGPEKVELGDAYVSSA